MKKLVIASVLALQAVCIFAAPKAGKGPGMVIKPGTQKGSVLFVNAQSRIDHAVFEKVAENWKNLIRVNIRAQKGAPVTVKTARSAAQKLGASLTLFIVDDAELDTSILAAPETKWCILNVRPIFDDKPDAKLANVRAMQETTRAFAILSGAMNSGYPNSLMMAVSSPRELDINPEPWRVPIDVMERFPSWYAAHGIAPFVAMPYRRACMEGWAPAPTNDAQKAVWDQVHTLPAKPLQLKK